MSEKPTDRVPTIEQIARRESVIHGLHDIAVATLDGANMELAEVNRGVENIQRRVDALILELDEANRRAEMDKSALLQAESIIERIEAENARLVGLHEKVAHHIMRVAGCEFGECDHESTDDCKVERMALYACDDETATLYLTDEAREAIAAHEGNASPRCRGKAMSNDHKARAICAKCEGAGWLAFTQRATEGRSITPCPLCNLNAEGQAPDVLMAYEHVGVYDYGREQLYVDRLGRITALLRRANPPRPAEATDD